MTAADTNYQGGNGVTVRLTVMKALQVIAYKQYQDSAQWSRIAAANGLTSFTADAGTALAGRTLTIPREASITWQYDSAGNITLYQKVKEGVVLKSVLSQYDQNGHNTLTRTDTTTVTPPSISANVALLVHAGLNNLLVAKTSVKGQEMTQKFNAAGQVVSASLRTYGDASKTYYYLYTYTPDGRQQSVRAYAVPAAMPRSPMTSTST